MHIRHYLITIVLMLAGCSHVQQRSDSTFCVERELTDDTCGKSSFISLDAHGQSENPTIAFVEFNEEGIPYDPSNINTVLSRLDTLNAESDKSVLIVAFIHGWHHNAAQTDRNVIEFKKFLLALQKEEESLFVGKPRTVVGVYIGWQAKASKSEVINLLSYRVKKELGLSTGEKSVSTVLEKLSEIRRDDRNNRLILVGHSFGGGVLYSAVRKELLNRLENPSKENLKLYGDLVVLVNPAVEAGRFVDVHVLLERDFEECTPISMASFTSEADTALSDEFPKGMRLFYADELNERSSEDDLLTTAYGRYSEFLNYKLRFDPNSEVESSLSKEVYTSAVPSWNSFRDGKSSFEFGAITLNQNKSGTDAESWKPVLNVSVDEALIAEHNEIWDPKFTYFLRGLIGMEFAKSRSCR